MGSATNEGAETGFVTKRVATGKGGLESSRCHSKFMQTPA